MLTGFSRYAQTPPAPRLELNAEATDYLCFSDNWPVLRVMLERLFARYP